MDAIRNYLDNMFANLPGTPAVLRAKKELGQMMEDKYTELIEEGKSENEAVGSVISEFGNLSELAEGLGLKDEIKMQAGEDTPISCRIITTEEAKDYIKARRNDALLLSLGVGLCIFSLICPILVSELLDDKYDIFGAMGMFLIVMIGVGLIIFSSIKKRPWKFLKQEKCTLSMDTTKYVKDEQNRYESIGIVEMIVGIIFCSCSWFPGGILDEFTSYGDSLGGAFFFLFIGIGVFLLLHSHGSMKGYKNLLNLNKAGTMKADYGKETSDTAQPSGTETGANSNPSAGEKKKEKITYISPLAEFFMDVYWPTVICLYLCASFITFHWGATWVIWPIAGILHGVFSRVLTE